MTDTEYRNGYALKIVRKHSASKVAEATEVISQWLSSFQNNQASGLLCVSILIEAVQEKSAWELAAGKADRINSESPEKICFWNLPLGSPSTLSGRHKH